MCGPALQQTSVNLAKGNFDGPHQSYQIGANDQLLAGKDYWSIVIAYRNGAPVMLSDVATVLDGVENVKQAAWMNNVPAVIVNIQRQPGANIIEVVRSYQNAPAAIEEHYTGFNSTLGPDRPDYDDSRLCRRCPVRTDVDRGARGNGDLSLFTHSFGDDHP